MSNQAGKGDTPRPFSVNRETFASNWERAFSNKTEVSEQHDTCEYSGLPTMSAYEDVFDRVKRQQETKNLIDKLENE